jgi:predicted CXXCH cytochrome family protein
MKVLLAVFFCPLLLCGQLNAAQLPEITGAVAYTEAVRFDYSKDGTKNRVQFWLEFKGSPASGEPGEAGYRPESGGIHYYLYDVDNKKRVDNWLMGFSMMEGPPPSGPYPMSNIEIQGSTSTFEAFGMKWTVIDGGEGHARDRVTIDDGFKPRDMKLYGGDLRVLAERTEDPARYKECLECHKGAVTEMLTKGGKHNSMGCGECHVDHPPETEKPYTPCTQCHQPHSEAMADGDCKMCHKAHTATEVFYAFNVPSRYCGACHQEVAAVLASSRSKHSDMACALCHQERHGSSTTCQHCHGAPHPEHVMKKSGICASCHRTAHDLESARAK